MRRTVTTVARVQSCSLSADLVGPASLSYHREGSWNVIDLERWTLCSRDLNILRMPEHSKTIELGLDNVILGLNVGGKKFKSRSQSHYSV